MNTQIAGLIRHILTLIGGVLVAFGVLNDDMVGQLTEAAVSIAGGVLVIIAFIKSWKAPEKKAF